jgi:hypothetical protein
MDSAETNMVRLMGSSGIMGSTGNSSPAPIQSAIRLCIDIYVNIELSQRSSWDILTHQTDDNNPVLFTWRHYSQGGTNEPATQPALTV